MPIDSVCPNCGARLRIPRKLVGSGRAKRCPKCGGALPIVARKRSPGGRPLTPASSKFDVDLVSPPTGSTIPCPHCRQPLALDAKLAGQVVACPHCRGQLQLPGGARQQAQAIACPYCSGHITAQPSLAGQVVVCPHCRGQVLMPG
jgi:DNA-directed RNA polymerase subunit RPC12/RpoP